MGLVGENKDTEMERRHRAVMGEGRKEGGPMIMGIRAAFMIPERIWTKPLYPYDLKRPSLLRALRVAV